MRGGMVLAYILVRPVLIISMYLVAISDFKVQQELLQEV